MHKSSNGSSMTGPIPDKYPDALTAEEMQGWLREELRDSAKALELRTKEATEFVTAYAEGKLTSDQAMDRLVKYDRRWGEALPGTSAFPQFSDEEILRNIDAAREADVEGTITSSLGRNRSTGERNR
jgi:hypothetical protein